MACILPYRILFIENNNSTTLNFLVRIEAIFVMSIRISVKPLDSNTNVYIAVMFIHEGPIQYDSIERGMTPRVIAIASRHLVCGTCSSWVDFDSSGCTNSCAEMRGAHVCLHAMGVGRWQG